MFWQQEGPGRGGLTCSRSTAGLEKGADLNVVFLARARWDWCAYTADKEM